MSTPRRYELSDLEWSVIQPLLPNKPRGVPRADDRKVLNGIYWRLRTGSPWADIPERYGPATTCANRFRRWACHITAHTPIEAATRLAVEHGFHADSIEAVTVRGTAKMARLHGNTAPADVIMAQYSIPWCVAAALLRDSSDPSTFGQLSLEDPRVAALTARVQVTGEAPAGLSSWGTEVEILLKDGRRISRAADDFLGTPEQPLSEAALRDKFLALTRGRPRAGEVFDRLLAIEADDELDWLGAL